MENQTHSTFPYRLELIVWEDAHEWGNGWHKEEDVEYKIDTSFDVKHVGWVIHEDDSKIVTVSRIATWSDDSEKMFSDVFTIPKPWVKDRIVLQTDKHRL